MRSTRQTKRRGGFGLTIDIDVLDPEVAPFVATPIQNGLEIAELSAALATISNSPRLLGLEVVEFTPRQDSDAAAACDLMVSLVTAVTGAGV